MTNPYRSVPPEHCVGDILLVDVSFGKVLQASIGENQQPMKRGAWHPKMVCKMRCLSREEQETLPHRWRGATPAGPVGDFHESRAYGMRTGSGESRG